MDRQPTLAGERVRLRPLRHGDYDALYAVACDPAIWAQHPARDRHRPEVFRPFFLEAMDSGGALLACDARSGEVIGSSRYHGHDPVRREVEIGWSFLARRCWGGATNGEMKRLMLAHAFRYVDSVVFFVGPDNLRSQRAVEKIGGLFAGTSPDADGLPRRVYRIRRG